MNKQKTFLLLTFLILSEIIYCTLYFPIVTPIILFTSVSIVNSIIFIFIVTQIKRDRFHNCALLFIIFGIIFRISVLFQPVTASDDIYRYIWDGKVQQNNINPYKFAPESKELGFLHSNIIPKYVNHPDIKTIYPPLSQYIFYISYKLFGENYYGFKFILLIFELATILFLFLTLKHLNIRPEYIAIYSICPLPIMQFMIDGHVDTAGISLLTAGLYFLVKKKYFISYLFLGFSISIKLITGMVLPYLYNKRNLKLILSIILPLIVFTLTYIPYLSSHVNPFESLATFTRDWTFNGSIFEIFFRLINDNQIARKITAAIFVLFGLLLFFSKKDLLYKIVLIFFIFLLLNPTVHPWYVTWLAALLALNFRWSGIAFITLVNLANFTVINYRLNGIWSMPDYILLIEYIPVYIFLGYEFYKEFKQNSLSGRTTGITEVN